MKSHATRPASLSVFFLELSGPTTCGYHASLPGGIGIFRGADQPEGSLRSRNNPKKYFIDFQPLTTIWKRTLAAKSAPICRFSHENFAQQIVAQVFAANTILSPTFPYIWRARDPTCHAEVRPRRAGRAEVTCRARAKRRAAAIAGPHSTPTHKKPHLPASNRNYPLKKKLLKNPPGNSSGGPSVVLVLSRPPERFWRRRLAKEDPQKPSKPSATVTYSDMLPSKNPKNL